MKIMNWLKYAITGILLSIVAVACIDDAENLIEDDDIADLLENTLNSKSGGFDAQLEDMLYLVENYQDQCGQSIDSTFEKERGIGSIATFNYTFTWAGTVNCDNNNVPQDIDFTYSTVGTYNVPNMSSTDEGNYNINVSGLLPTNTHYNLAGTYTRTGTQTAKLRNELTFTATIGVSLTQMSIEKATKNISSGSAAFTVTGETSGGTSISKDGTITYNNDNTVTINLNNKEYTFNLD